MPQFCCHLCKEPLVDGFMICPCRGSYLTEQTDLQKALLHQRLEGLIRKMNLTNEESGFDSAGIRGSAHRVQGDESRPAQSLQVIRTARNQYDRAITGGHGSIINHVHHDPFAASNYATQSVNPEMMDSITQLA